MHQLNPFTIIYLISLLLKILFGGLSQTLQRITEFIACATKSNINLIICINFNLWLLIHKFQKFENLVARLIHLFPDTIYKSQVPFCTPIKIMLFLTLLALYCIQLHRRSSMSRFEIVMAIIFGPQY